MSKPPITITGLPAAQTAYYGTTIHPLAGITVKDINPHALVHADVVLSTDHLFIDGNLTGSGLTKLMGGRGGSNYITDTVSPAALTKILRGITFAVPTPDPSIPPDPSLGPETDRISLDVTDGTYSTPLFGAGTSFTESAKPPPPPPVIKPHNPPPPVVPPHDPPPVVHAPPPPATLGSLFNATYYLNQNPDLAGVDLLSHYEQTGWKEGRDPSANFSTSAYLKAYPDVAALHVDPMEQYLNSGQIEGRMTFLAMPHGEGPQNAMVDNSYYFGRNADIKTLGIDPTEHYNTFGWKEGRDPSAAFSTDKYLAANADVKAAGVNPLIHYEQFGASEGRAIYHT